MVRGSPIATGLFPLLQCSIEKKRLDVDGGADVVRCVGVLVWCRVRTVCSVAHRVLLSCFCDMNLVFPYAE